MTQLDYPGQTTHLKDTKEEIDAIIGAAWSCFGKKNPTRKHFEIDNSPYHSKIK